MQNYKDLKIWMKAHYFTLQVYTNTKQFPKEETYGLTNQLRRSSSSIDANIAEGCGKNTKRDLANFLNISVSSSNEAEYFLILAKVLGYITLVNYDILEILINEVKSMIRALIGKVRD